MERAFSEPTMFNHLALNRPLAILDVETTGVDPKVDRIVEISVLRMCPQTGRDHRTRRLNPTVPIPAEATLVHGIRDADVADMPKFADVAPSLLAFLDGCDLCGFNLKRFDLRILNAEFARAGHIFALDGRAIIDPMEIFHAYEKRDLTAAVRFYLARSHDQGHAAAADVQATAEVLDAMLARYADLPRTVADLHQHFKDRSMVDSDGFFSRVGDEIRFRLGKHRGQPLEAVATRHPDYLRWMLTQHFFADTKAVASAALHRNGQP